LDYLDILITNLNNLFKEKKEKFTAKLRGGYRDFLSLCNPTHAQLPPSSASPIMVAHLLQLMNLYYIITQSPSCTLLFTLGWCIFHGFGQMYPSL